MGSKRVFEFFRSRTLDFVSFGSNFTKQGAIIGLPSNYFAKTKEELLKDVPLNGFDTLFGQSIDLNQVNAKNEELIDNFLLSDDAKLFGLARAVAQTDRFIITNSDLFVDFATFAIGYIYCFSRNREYKMHLSRRKKMYLGAILAGVTVSLLSKFLIYKYVDQLDDKNACRLGLDCCQGSQEFYQKLIKRNQILRELIPDGSKYIDKDGNYLKQLIHIPFTDRYFFINFMGEKLTKRQEICKAEFNKMLITLNQEKESVSEEDIELKEAKAKELEDKEWPFFKKLRTRLENIQNSTNK